MGTDIHFYVEKRVNDAWKHLDVSEVVKKNYAWSRDYELFAYLAGVRNSFGFAGCFAGRGLPSDTSFHKDDAYLGDHSFTYATLQELLECRPMRRVARCGYFDRSQIEVFDKEGRPNYWFGGVVGENISVTDNFEDFKNHEYYKYCYQEWDVDELMIHPFWDWVQTLKDHTDNYEHIRVLMGFDS